MSMDGELGSLPTVTLECDLCDFVATGPDTGAGSARFKLGTHKYREHGVRSSKKKRSAAGVVTDEDVDARPVLALVRDAADQVGGTGTPNAEQLSAGLGRGLGLITVAVASFAAETDPNIADGPDADAERDRIVSYLSLSDKAARDTMRPIGKALAPTTFNKKYGRGVIENVDVAASVAELATLAMHWRSYFRRRSQWAAMAAPAPTFQSPTVPTMGTAPMPAGPPMPTEPLTSPAPQEGVVVTAEMVQQVLQRRG